jgi:alpha,alpha-trehalase
LGTVRTLSILPVDLNSLLVHLEHTLAEAYLLAGNDQQAAVYHRRAVRRAEAIGSLMWDAQHGIFTDYLWRNGRLTSNITAATLYPLFLQVATVDQARAVAKIVEHKLLDVGGWPPRS